MLTVSIINTIRLPLKKRAPLSSVSTVAKMAEGVAVALVTALIGMSAVYFDLFEKLTLFASRHENWQLDELINVLFFFAVCAIVLSIRHNIQLRREVKRREYAEFQAQRLARHDPLTGLPNRRVFLEELGERIHQGELKRTSFSVLLIDLDRFRPVNDLYGHSVGDFVLCQIAEGLQSCLEPGQVLARLGADEFALLVEAEPGSDAPLRLAKRLIGMIGDPIAHAQARIEIGASIGIAVCPQDGNSPEDLMRAADLAMHRAKKDERGSVRYFEMGMDAELRSRQALEAKLRRAIHTQQIRPHYQPLVHLETREVIGFELLARWYDPDEGIIMPSTFISIAEDTNILSALSYSILRQACREARFWPDTISFALNISPSQLKDPSLAKMLLSIIDEEGFCPKRLEIEVTESALVGDLTVAKETLETLRNAGVKIAIDDFGTGYSGLFHLRELKFDKLKIDRSFVQNLEDPENEKIIHAIVSLGRSLGLPTTAEGVEEPEQLKKLIELGCEYGQGYYFGKPRASSANEIKLQSTRLIA